MLGKLRLVFLRQSNGQKSAGYLLGVCEVVSVGQTDESANLRGLRGILLRSLICPMLFKPCHNADGRALVLDG